MMTTTTAPYQNTEIALHCCGVKGVSYSCQHIHKCKDERLIHPAKTALTGTW